MKVGYFVCEEGSKAIGEGVTWSRGMNINLLESCH